MGFVWSVVASVPRWIRLLRTFPRATAIHLFHSIFSGFRSCSRCRTRILPLETFYCCGTCCTDGCHDLCNTCHHRKDNKDNDDDLQHYHHRFHAEVVPLPVDTNVLSRAASCGSSTVAILLEAALKLYGPRPCLGERLDNKRRDKCSSEDGSSFDDVDYDWISYKEVLKVSLDFGSGLASLFGSEKNSSRPYLVGLLGSPASCREWLITDYACALKGIGLVVMHRTTKSCQLEHILRSTALEVLLISKHLRLVLENSLANLAATEGGNNEAAPKIASLRIVVWIDDSPDAHPRSHRHSSSSHATVALAGSSIIEFQWSDVAALGAMQPQAVHDWVSNRTPLEAIAKLLPSSGTTGCDPKLTVVTESSLKSQMVRTLMSPSSDARSLLPPVLYAYDVMRQTHDVLLRGGKIGCSTGSLSRFTEDCRILCPTSVAGSASLWNGLRAEFEAEVRRRRCGGPLDRETSTSEQEILLEWMDCQPLGNRVKALVSTGTPLPHKTRRFLCRVFAGCALVDAYGTTETGSLAANGRVSEHAEVRLVDRPELGYTTADQPHPRGEIFARTRGSTCGYFDRGKCRDDGTFDVHHAITNSRSTDTDWITLDDIQYFRTGDVGELLGNGQIRVIDRCKSHFKLSQGLFVSPLRVEEALKESDLVSQIFVWGTVTMSSVAAVVVPTEKVSLGNENLERRLLESLRRIGSSKGLLPWEIPQKIVLESEPFSEENGLLAAGSKLCRSVLKLRYRDKLSDGGETKSNEDDFFQLPPVDAGDNGLCAGLVEALQLASNEPSLQPTASESLVSLGMDSMAVGRLSSILQDRFDACLSARILYGFPTLADLERVLFGGEAAAWNVAVRAKVTDWRHEVEKEIGALERDLGSPCVQSMACCCTSGEEQAPIRDTVLLTGATGFLGSFLLREIVQSTVWKGCRICCLIRAPNANAATHRLHENLDWYGLRSVGEIGCCSVLVGDLTSTYLGLCTDDYIELVTRIKAIFHCAAQVTSTLPYAALRETNVAGTRRVVALSLLAGAEFIHVSTMGFLPSTDHPETFRVSHEGLVERSGYAQSKWVAEQLVAEAASRFHCRARVFRPGSIAGDSQSGASNPKDATSMLLLGLVTEGLVCSDNYGSPIPQEYNLCPVDFVAASILRISELSWDDYKMNFGENCAFHMCASEWIRLDTICRWIRSGGYPLKEVSPTEFCWNVRKLKDENHPFFPLKSLLSYPAPEKHGQRRANRFCMDNTAKALKAANAQRGDRRKPIPLLTDTWLLRVIDFLMKGHRQQQTIK